MNIAKYNELKNKIIAENSLWLEIIIELINEYNKHVNYHLIQDLVLRMLDKKDLFNENINLLNRLVLELGLFPYVEGDGLDFKTKFGMDVFLSPINQETTFHVKQAEVYYRIINGENIVLSAPTSFGKSLIIDALISSQCFNNIVVVVPTIALMDELKKKFHKHNATYKIITQSNQDAAEKNIFIYTQERVIERNFKTTKVDFFIIDEFYKLAPSSNADYRCDRLNIAFYKLYNICKRFYMLGPNIDGIIDGLEEDLNCSFVKFDKYKTVAADEFYYELKTKGKDEYVDIERDEYLKGILKNLNSDEQTVIYCKSPKRANSLMSKILAMGLTKRHDENNAFTRWLRDNYHPEWSLANAVDYGVACHHAKLPRAIGSFIVDSFNKKSISVLVCTSTLIEGVNTNAKNVIIYDDCITGRTKLDSFTFNNISGRSGRMFEHFVGKIHIIGSRPKQQLPLIDIPIITLSEKASDSMLLQIQNDLSETNLTRIFKYTHQQILPIELINKHQGVSPEKLLTFADALMEQCGKWHNVMAWDSLYPTKDQLNHLCFILFEYFSLSRMGNGAVKTASQLHTRLRSVMSHESDLKLINDEYSYWKNRSVDYTPDDAVQVIFDFKRNLVSYNLPKIILAINDIQKLIFSRFDYTFGDYTNFCHALEAHFELPTLVTLEEFGIPMQVSKKIAKIANITAEDNIDITLSKIKLTAERKDVINLLGDFETSLLKSIVCFL
ncbi:DEAD/DEAH box helicase [Yersinia enterocolitica]